MPGIDNAFGLSAPAEKIYEHFGFGIVNLTARANDVVAFYTAQGKTMLWLVRYCKSA